MPVNVRARGWSALFGTLIALLATVGVAQTPPSFQTRVDVVVVEATVLDRAGAVINLTPADFAVEIDGKVREVVSADFVRHDDAGAGAEYDRGQSGHHHQHRGRGWPDHRHRRRLREPAVAEPRRAADRKGLGGDARSDRSRRPRHGAAAARRQHRADDGPRAGDAGARHDRGASEPATAVQQLQHQPLGSGSHVGGRRVRLGRSDRPRMHRP